jgi:hypothetical protein
MSKHSIDVIFPANRKLPEPNESVSQDLNFTRLCPADSPSFAAILE